MAYERFGTDAPVTPAPAPPHSTQVRYPSYTAVLQALCCSAVASKLTRVQGAQDQYRCKATYSLLPQLSVSSLSIPRVNDVAVAVDTFCKSISHVPVIAADFFLEVCVKVNRVGQYMVKLTLSNRLVGDGEAMPSRATLLSLLAIPVPSTDCPPLRTLFDFWYESTERPALEQHLRASVPGLVAIIAHVRQPEEKDGATGALMSVPLRAKPDKSSHYVPLTQDAEDVIVEYTPNGIPFSLSADAFCEVNHVMEDAIFHAIVTFLRLGEGTHARGMPGAVADGAAIEYRPSLTPTVHTAAVPSPPSPPPVATRRHVFMSGRDVNSVVRTFEGYYDATTVVTSCPRVFADAVRNGIDHCQLRSKDRIGESLRLFADAPPSASVASSMHGALSDRRAAASDSVERHVLMTAGRQGLHPRTTVTVASLAAREAISDFVYVSCNVASLTRDAHILKEAMFIAHVRTFDFFPGTDYVMTVLHWKPLRSAASCDLLLLPVGLPGTGKSTCGRALMSFFQDAAKDRMVMVAEEKTMSRSKNRKTGKHRVHAHSPAANASSAFPTTAACSVPRSFLSLPPSVIVYRHAERDQIFCEYKTQLSLKRAKVKTHEAILAVLGGWDNPTDSHNEFSLRCGEDEGRAKEEAAAIRATTATAASVDRENFSCPRRVLYLDSTNGSSAARNLYYTSWLASSSRGTAPRVKVPPTSSVSLSSCLTLFFTAPPPPELLRRVQQRGVHPSFPSSPDEQRRKLEVIAMALASDDSTPRDEEVEERSPAVATDSDRARTVHMSSATWRIAQSMKENSPEETVCEVVVSTVAHLLFAADIADLFIAAAVNDLCGTQSSFPVSPVPSASLQDASAHAIKEEEEGGEL